MSRTVCLAIVVGSLLAAPGCSSCFGGSSCRRPSFMEFRSPCSSGRTLSPMAPACGAPACEPACAPAAAPCCDEGGIMSSPRSAPVVVGEAGTFS